LLANKGPIIAPAVRSGQIKVISAVYDIATGRVSL
jgi:carbonic anhydrase